MYRSKDQQWALVTHRYTKLQQRHADDIIGAVAVADRERLGLKSVGILLICDVKCHKLARRRRERGGDVDVVLTEGEEELTYAQFPMSLAKIFRGTVLGSSLSFPSRIPLEGRTDVRLT